jgi:arylsulfatase A-like enzyme
LRLYGNPVAATPHIERLAEQGLVFEHAFSCAPVCSVARTTLMSAMYAPRVGFQFHRRSQPAHLPESAQLFPAYLRQAGYYTTNNSKKDYNVIEGQVWDESSKTASWRRRPTADTSFFHMQTTAVTHESSLHFSPEQMRKQTPGASTEGVRLPPYHPDTPTFRFTHARYLDRMHTMDQEVGRLVEQLQRDGLLEDTFIFYFGDHGGVLPRSKGYLYETGLHVPLVVRVPKNWRHLVTRPLASRPTGFVSFVDFGPTVLNLAGLKTPGTMDGKPFLGEGVSDQEVDRRDETYGYADRFDEKYDLCRSLRKGRFKYIRNYQPFYPDSLHNNYRYQMLAYAEWRERFRQGKLNAIQRQFFEPKPAEALFDLEQDPHEVHNLAVDPAFAETLLDLRSRLKDWVKGLPDLSFYPESLLVDEALEDGVAFGAAHRQDIGRLVDVADLALEPFEDALPKLKTAMASDDRWQRYWALIACSCFGKRAEPLVAEAKERLLDEEPLVRVRAAEFLGLIGAADAGPTLLEVLATSNSSDVALLTMNTIVFLRDHGSESFELDPARIRVKAGSPTVDRRIEYLKHELPALRP